MARNLHIECGDESPQCDGCAAIEMAVESGEPALVGCTVVSAGRWGTCVRVTRGMPQIVRNHFGSARWGVVMVGADGRVEDAPSLPTKRAHTAQPGD